MLVYIVAEIINTDVSTYFKNQLEGGECVSLARELPACQIT